MDKTSRLASSKNKKRNILCVDNEPDTTTILKMAPERVGFTIVTFNDLELALKRFKPNTYGLVILDVMMKRMDGFELYNRLKKRDPGVNVCFLTASSEMYRKELKKEKHCELNKDLFLNMPLPIEEIVEEINRRMGSA